jgi:UDP-N-acetylmuramoyl-L-alanyl-D-glutamate--2,6-diaminopimelate ligase
VLVDYAHTPDAIRQVLDTLRPLCEGRLFVIFGCGGDRDRTKRPIMGAAAGGGADLVVVTSDNPRTEDPRSIIEMAAEGVVESGKSPIKLEDLSVAKSGYVVVDDRREAIRWAIAASRPGDVVLVAGKGHEDYQILGTRRVHFDDREEARKALDRAASTGQEETDRSGGEEKD